MKQGNTAVIIAVIIVFVAIASGMIGWILAQNSPPPAHQATTPPTAPVAQTQPAMSVSTQPPTQPQATKQTSANIPADWKTYNFPKVGISFQYPSDVKVDVANPNSNAEFLELNADQSNSNWPIIEIQYNLAKPKGDFKTWVLAHSPHDQVETDTTISGLTAVHLLNNRSAQSYAIDEYHVLFHEKLYEISLIHSERIPDWTAYNAFLSSIQIQ